jgi:hypothetical protein
VHAAVSWRNDERGATRVARLTKNSSGNALRKQNVATSALQQMGYEERQTGTNHNGKTYWLMIKDGMEHDGKTQSR